MINKKGYNGNINLRPAGVQISYTAEQTIEVAKCADDVIYFIETYCKTISVDKGIVPFKLFDYQKRFISTMLGGRFTICKLFRQGGKSTVTAAVLLHYIIFNKAKSVAILANKAAQAREVLSRLQMMYEFLPSWMQHGIRTWNKGDIELENGSKAFAAATSPNSIRGKSISWLYLDEFAFVDNNKAEDFFVSSYPTVSSGTTTKITITSTPNGYNLFWKFWDSAEKGINGFSTFEAHYSEKPGNDDAWAAQQRSILGDLKFRQEVLMTFNGSSNTLIDGDIISRMAALEPVYQKDDLDVLAKPDETKKYIVCVDVARGLLGDHSTAVVIDISEKPYRIAAKYRSNKVTPLLFPAVIYKIAKDYNEAFVLIELNDAGEQVSSILFNEYEYENLISTYKKGTKQMPTLGGTKGGRKGLVTSKSTKAIGCSQLKIMIEENKLLVEDADTISEFSTFIEKKGSYEADTGYHDDLVMPLVSFGWLSSTELFKHLTESNLRVDIYSDREKNISDHLTPFGFVDRGAQVHYKDSDGVTWVAKGDVESRDQFQRRIMENYGFDKDFDNWFYN